MKKHIFSALIFVPYLTLAALPTSAFWYDPGEVRIIDTAQGSAPKVEFFRHIKRPTSISYSTVTRNERNDIVCEGRGGPFTYKPGRGILSGKDLVWWSAGDERCGNLPVGHYWPETCWTVVAPTRALLPDFLKDAFGWLLPPKRVCRVSQPFEIY